MSALPVYPPDDGIALRCFNLLQQISARWPIILVAPVRDGAEPLTSRIPQLVEHHTVVLDGRWPVTQWHFDSAPLREAADRVLRERQISAAVLWPGAEALCLDRGFPRSLVDRIDSVALIDWRFARSDPALRMKAWFAMHALKVALYEWKVARTAAATVLVGDDDASVMGLGGRLGHTYVVPNGVEPFVNVDDVREAPVPTVVFTGVLEYLPNVDAVLHFVSAVWPSIRRDAGNARFLIAGRRPTEAILRLHGRDGIEVHADVPSVGAVLREGWVAVAPMRSGSGLKNKILEAWIASRPVVATPMAINGLRLPEGMSRFVTNDAGQMAAMIVELFRDSAMRARLGAAAAAHAARFYSWEAVGRQFSTVIEKVIAAPVPAAP